MQHCWVSNYGASFVVKVKPKPDKYYKRFQTLSFAMVMLAFLLLKIKHLFETGPGTGETHPKATFIYSPPPGLREAAVRAPAFKWIRILCRCWQTKTPYNESVYLNALKRRGSPLLNPSTTVKMT
jgi:hypothetical protein